MIMCLPNDSSNKSTKTTFITVEVASFEFAVEGFNILLISYWINHFLFVVV